MANGTSFVSFKFPEDIGKISELKDTPVCVVSVFGKTQIHGNKTAPLSRLLERTNIFSEQKKTSYVQGCVDTEKQLVVLECCSGYDTNDLAALLHSSKELSKEWDSVLYTKARVLLYAFHISHILVCFTPGLSLDTTYIRLFRALEHTRNKLHLNEELSQLGLPKSWCGAGRPTCPRMLFVFNPINKHIFKKDSSMKEQKRALEEMIYKIFRKTRIITTHPNTALFSLSTSHSYVHIMSESECTTSRGNLLKLFDLYSRGQSPESVIPSETNHSFRDMLMCQVNLVHGPGFEYPAGRSAGSHTCHVVALKRWFKLASHLYTLLVSSLRNGQDTPKLCTVFSSLKSTIEVEQRFSETRCHKVMQLAENAYQDNLPEHYTEGVHEEQLAKARHVMIASGRGPALQTYLTRLKKDCTSYWENGHRLCESVSLSGNHCIHPLHRLPDQPITDENEKLPCSDHSTSASFTVACNCGRTTKNTGDLFTAKYANHILYEEMSVDCCSTLESVAFPVYSAPVISTTAPTATPSSSQPTSPKAKAESTDAEVLTDKMASLTIFKLKQEEEELTTMSDQHSYCNSLSQGHHRPEVSKTDASVTEESSETTADEVVEGTKSGYLDHMLTNTSIKGLLPDYPSWALTCLGTYSSYNPSSGLDQPGFLSSSNFLLPWEVIIKGIVKDQTWPHITEPTTHKQRKKMAAKKHVVDTTAKIYIGDAYMCPQGHRFFCSSPDKVIKVTGSTLKDNANKLLTMDMPLYTRCPKNDGCVGQLRHIYVCTPEIESLVVSLLPKIQPAPIPCPLFLPSHDGPIKLRPNGLWVMRLPHFFVDENGPYPLLADPGSMMSCRLLKGTFNFRNTSDPLL
ncbi:nonsense-mediated mRNA decay factor SMG8-like [Watersipora subatra]|uniref:nonsense-mediated mRNA decay factor SMG8-like n=1 Tax=Watersipora subatra TaxID=2589382 RepID=UPI00355B1D78